MSLSARSSLLQLNYSKIKEKAQKHPIWFGLVIAALFSLILITPYLIQPGMKTFTNGVTGSDLFSGLPFVIERSYVLHRWGTLFYDWGPFYSAPNFVGDSNFYIVPQLITYLVIPDVALTYKVLDFLLFFSSFFTMYLLAYTISGKARVLSGVIAGLFYSLTPYFLLELTNHFYLMFAYALLPLAFFCIYRALEGSDKKYLWTCLAGMSIAASITLPSPEYTYVNGLFLFLFAAILCLKDIRSVGITPVVKKLVYIPVMFVIAFLLSAYFILPMVFSSNPYGIATVFSRVASFPFYSNNMFESVFLLDKGVDVSLNYLTVYGPAMIAFVFPMLLSCSLLYVKRKSISIVYLLFFTLGFLAILLSMGPTPPPFLRIFEFAQSLPLFNLIRTPCRFTVQIALSFCLLGGIAIGLLSQKVIASNRLSFKTLKHDHKMLAAATLVVIVIVSYTASGVTLAYSVAGPYEIQQLPDTPSKVVAWLNQVDPNQDYKIIDVTATRVIASYHRSQLNGADLIMKYWCSPALADIFANLNVKYIITDNNAMVTPELSKLPHFYRLSFGQDYVYVNTLAQKSIYSAYGALNVGGPNVLSTFYTALDGTRYSNTSGLSYDESAADWALFSPDVLTNTNHLVQYDNFNAVVFGDSDIQDLAFMQLNSTFKYQALNYLNPNWAVVDDASGTEESTANFYQNTVDGQLVLSQRAIFSTGNATLQIPINDNGAGTYDVWVRASNVLPNETSNIISVGIDGSSVGQANFGAIGGFKWLQVNNASVPLSSGAHKLNLSTGNSSIYLDMIAVVPVGKVNAEMARQMSAIADIPQMYVFEFSNYFVGANSTKETKVLPFASYSSLNNILAPVSTSFGYLTLPFPSNITQEFYVSKSGNYSFDIRVMNRPDGGKVSVNVDGQTLSQITTKGPTSSWKWVNVGQIALAAGKHTIQVTSESGNNSLDIMSLIEEPLAANLFNQPGVVQFEQNHLNSWNGTLNYSSPGFLVFAETYYPEWVFELQANSSPTQISPLQAFYSINAYYINGTGVKDFSIYHLTSQLRSISFAATILTFMACLAVICASAIKAYVSPKIRGKRFG